MMGSEPSEHTATRRTPGVFGPLVTVSGSTGTIGPVKTYRICAWWDLPGIAQPGEDDLGEGWCRVYDTAVVKSADAVAAYLRGHPDAENATVDEIETHDGQESLIGTHWAQRTILGWLIGPTASAGVE